MWLYIHEDTDAEIRRLAQELASLEDDGFVSGIASQILRLLARTYPKIPGT